jgi:hypothetical protein
VQDTVHDSKLQDSMLWVDRIWNNQNLLRLELLTCPLCCMDYSTYFQDSDPADAARLTVSAEKWSTPQRLYAM